MRRSGGAVMRRGFRSGGGSAAPLYFVYRSRTKVNMLYPQIPQRLARSLEAEVKANVGSSRRWSGVGRQSIPKTCMRVYRS